MPVRDSIKAMEWFIAVIAVAALGVAAMAAAGGMGQMSEDPVHDTYRQALPDRPLTGDDLEQLRFGITLRGYAMGQVDDLLDRLSGEIAARDARIAELLGLSAPAEHRAQPVAVAAPGPDDADTPHPYPADLYADLYAADSYAPGRDLGPDRKPTEQP